MFIEGREDAVDKDFRSFQVLRIMSEGQVRGSEFIRRGFAGPVFSAPKGLDAISVDVEPDRAGELCREARRDLQSDIPKTRNGNAFAQVGFECSVLTGRGGLMSVKRPG